MNPVVIDTNCLLQIISHRSPYRPIWDAFLAGRFTLCASNEILDEYQEILEQQITPTVAENVVMLILNRENVLLVDPHFRMGIITADPDDKGGVRETTECLVEGTSSSIAPSLPMLTIWCPRTATSAYSTTRRSHS